MLNFVPLKSHVLFEVTAHTLRRLGLVEVAVVMGASVYVGLRSALTQIKISLAILILWLFDSWEFAGICSSRAVVFPCS